MQWTSIAELSITLSISLPWDTHLRKNVENRTGRTVRLTPLYTPSLVRPPQAATLTEIEAAREILPVKLHALEHHSLISLRVGLLSPNRDIKENLYLLFASSRLSSSHSTKGIPS
ncbi:unnamed protein product [Dovyalis caffra]|uniref:Uncharacterized protein n=1 Tax=Dovyalis caffra TaxID=77055 RepID=A0AAV1QSC1_9ROSI|nr:unnamed protein product [Dovyalis caffra]CAK7328778.1 unnamed protein product [Dovyalis caffra]